jgi:hypothetical protein
MPADVVSPHPPGSGRYNADHCKLAGMDSDGVFFIEIKPGRKRR